MAGSTEDVQLEEADQAEETGEEWPRERGGDAHPGAQARGRVNSAFVAVTTDAEGRARARPPPLAEAGKGPEPLEASGPT